MSGTLARSLAHFVPLNRLNADAIINDIRAGDLIQAEDALMIFMDAGGFWHYDPDADTHAHVLINSDSGNHSDGFVDCSMPLRHPQVCSIFVAQLIYGLRQRLGNQKMRPPTVVVSSSQAMASEFGRQMGIRSIFTGESASQAGGKPTFDIKPGDCVLIAEESFATPVFFEKQIALISQVAPEDFSLFPVLLTLVNLSGQKGFQNHPIVSLLSSDDTSDLRFNAWAAEDCPLCSRGSVAVKPNSPEGWRQLTGQA